MVRGLCCIWVSSEAEHHGGRTWWGKLLMVTGKQRREEEGVGFQHVLQGNVSVDLNFPLGLPLVDVTSNSTKVGG